MTVVMQPYLFPYPGYYQLIDAADTFVLYDDVQFIQRGYINRNELASGAFTVPLTKMPQTALVRERTLHPVMYKKFLRKWYRGFEMVYRKAPYYAAALDLAQRTFDEGADNIGTLAARSVRLTTDYLGLRTSFRRASDLDYDRTLSGQDRMLALLKQLGASGYVNSYNGRHLYEREGFAERGIELHFLQPELSDFPDKAAARFSILHLIAYHPPATARQWIADHYSLQQ